MYLKYTHQASGLIYGTIHIQNSICTKHVHQSFLKKMQQLFPQHLYCTGQDKSSGSDQQYTEGYVWVIHKYFSILCDELELGGWAGNNPCIHQTTTEPTCSCLTPSFLLLCNTRVYIHHYVSSTLEACILLMDIIKHFHIVQNSTPIHRSSHFPTL